MEKKILGFIVLLLLSPIFSIGSHSINHKLLEMEADICVGYLNKGYPIERKQIEERLKFVTQAITDADLATKENLDPSLFKQLYRKILDDTENSNTRLLNFTSGCRIVYEESQNLATRVVIPFLLEKVTKKYTNFLKQWKRLRDLEWQQENDLRYDNPEMRDVFLYAFMNADKDITIPVKENTELSSQQGHEKPKTKWEKLEERARKSAVHIEYDPETLRKIHSGEASRERSKIVTDPKTGVTIVLQ